jgi:hypothetical protein
MSRQDLPAGHTLRAAGIWCVFHLQRHLRRASFWLWAAALGLLAAAIHLLGAPRLENADLQLVHLAAFATLFFTTGAVREELEDRTITYGYARPVDRGALYVARMLAALGPALLVCVPGVILTSLGHQGLLAPRWLAALALSGLAHGALFALIGQLIKWPTWAGLAWLILWEAPISRLPGVAGDLTLAAAVRAVAGLPTNRLPAPGWVADAPLTAAGGALTLTLVAALALTLGARRARRREADPGK